MVTSVCNHTELVQSGRLHCFDCDNKKCQYTHEHCTDCGYYFEDNELVEQVEGLLYTCKYCTPELYYNPDLLTHYLEYLNGLIELDEYEEIKSKITHFKG